MQSVEFKGIEQLNDVLDDLLNEIPEARRELHDRIADVLKKEVDSQIDSSGLNDSSGKIKSWQEPRVGSGGGYAAISAIKGATGNNSPGAITNYLENGHRIRPPSGRSKRYRPRINTPYIDGYHFYQQSANAAEAKAISEAEKYVEEIIKKLEE